MIDNNPNNSLQFGRVIYVDPNNNIVGDSKNTNFTFKPEDYSILVDLQVDVVDRFAYNGSGGNEVIQYTLEWDAKGTKTSLFKGTNGMLTTKALNTSFDDITRNLNQEAIGINSIDIRYNSWNYPEVTINFTDIRGASLLASADFIHADILPEEQQRVFDNNFANTFFSTFFRFPYPRYTLMVKGFYGRPVTYSLCVNDFKTKFNSQTGNFDVTVSFIGYMYGLLTDIPMSLLFVAPYCEYSGKEYWDHEVSNGNFTYAEGTGMITFFDLKEQIEHITSNLSGMTEIIEIMDGIKSYEREKASLQNINGIYYSYTVGTTSKNFSTVLNGNEVQSRKYVFRFTDASMILEGGCERCGGNGYISRPTANKSVPYVTTFYGDKCPDCNGTGKRKRKRESTIDFNDILIGDDIGIKTELVQKIEEYNTESENGKIKFIPRIENESQARETLKGTIVYVRDEKSGTYGFVNPTRSDCGFVSVADGDFEKVTQYLQSGDVLNTINTKYNAEAVAVTILRVDEFEKSVNDKLSVIDSNLDLAAKEMEDKQSEAYERLLSFKVTLKNIIDMCLAHLDTFMHCMYVCMDNIRDKKEQRTFSQAGLLKSETDVRSTVNDENKVGGGSLYLPPFFAFRKKNMETDEYEDAWIGSDARFSNEEIFQEIKLINGLLNGTLSAETTAKELAESLIGKRGDAGPQGQKIGEEYTPTFISDYYASQNPYKEVFDGKLETLIAMFAFRCMIASVYGMDYPSIGNRFDSGDRAKKKYFETFARNDANNLAMNTTEFKSFCDSTLPEIFSGFTWADFEKYITGQANEGGIVQNEHGHLYFAGSMANASPLFTRGGYSGLLYKNDYAISYGIEEKKAYMLPLLFSSPHAAVTIANNIYNSFNDGGGMFETNGIGISRNFAFPVVEIIDNDRILCDDIESIKTAFDGFIEPDHGKDFQHLGWYFKNVENWKEYFAGPIRIFSNNWWFPSIVKIDGIRSNLETKKSSRFKDFLGFGNDVGGNLYTGGLDDKGEKIYAYAPMSETTDIKSFFCGDSFAKKLISILEDESNTVKNSESNDNYIEKKVVPSLISSDSDVTLIGLPCAQGTLFESEFYLYQNNISNEVIETIRQNIGKQITKEDIIKYRKAFLFLHSLPTAEYGALSRVMETIIKRTYTPSVTDIPLTSALFIGALYWRMKANGEDGDREDCFICYNDNVNTEYQTARANQLLTYSYGNDSNIQREITRRPLHPIKKEEIGKFGDMTEVSLEYLDVTYPILESLIESEEKNFTYGGAQNLKSKLEDNATEGYRYVGFWDVPEYVKEKFMEMFTKWVDKDFGYIESELSLRDPSGEELTIKQVKALKEIIRTKVFNEYGVAKQDYNNAGYVIHKEKNDLAFNNFIRKALNNNFFDNHIKFGASTADNSLFTFLDWNSEVMGKINSLLSSGCVVKIPFPRVLMTRDMLSPEWDEERLSLKVSEDVLKKAWETFQKQVMINVEGRRTEDKEDAEAIQRILPPAVTDGDKLSLYETLKNIHDKWLITTKKEKYKFISSRDYPSGGVSIGQNFFYINSFYEDVGHEITLNIEQLPKQITNVIESNKSANSLYSFMYDLAAQANTQLLALPVFNNLSDPSYVREMFSPIPYDELDATKVYTETQYVFFYPEEASKQVNIANDAKNEEDRYKFADDSFTLVTEAGQQNVTDVPNTFSDINKGRNVPVFGVTFAKQNQSFFKNINVSMDSPKTTEVAIHNTLTIANKFKAGNSQVTALGQDLFPIYSNYSYECSVEMMGCACIMPLMYFQLNNIPMFKGTYIIYNVSHSITPGNMTTTFSGQRLSRYRKKRNDEALATFPNDRALRTIRSSTEKSYDSIIDDCYTEDGHKLENEYVYSIISKNSGVTDRAALRAVEYAETHYAGGFFPDGKPRVYYDPWMGKSVGVSGEGLTVSSQFAQNYTTPDNYQDNLVKIARAAESLGDEAKASACTITGAFGVPAQLWSKCGAASLEEFYEKTAESFTCQGSYFAELLKNDDELRTSLQNKDWKKFAKRYKARKSLGGITELGGDGGVFSPGDDANFTLYAKDLEAGYIQASGANSDNRSKFIPNNGEEMHINEPGFNPNKDKSEEYASKHPFKNVTAARSIASHSSGAYQQSVCPRPKWVVDYSTNINDHPMKGDGTKPEKQSISRCATYVKIALYDGGLECESCNGGKCAPFLERSGWEEIYRSKPGEPWSGASFNAKWKPGDLVTIDPFTEANGKNHSVGHIAMWTGNEWCSDYKQSSCLTYNAGGPTHWNQGGYHFWRYRNTTDT